MLQQAISLLLLCLDAANGLPRPESSFPRAVSSTRTVFLDDFSGLAVGSLPSRAKWTIDLGTSYPGGPSNWGTGETQVYTNRRTNIAITKYRTLKITPVRERDGTWTSARIETTKAWDFGCPLGQRLRVDAMIKLGADSTSKQLGIWPAFWALGSAYRGNYQNWPSVGEVDILESVNGQNKMHQIVHCDRAPGGVCNEFSGIGRAMDGIQRGLWHTFSWEVDRRPGLREETMTWFIDGRKHWTLKQSDLRSSSAWKALAQNSKMLLLNVAVGGSFPDAVAGYKTPTSRTVGGDGASMEVAWVYAYTSTK
ncbi:glucan endo-1,3-beta-glucosidase A1-like protein [Drechmeria coniospora]|uniref:Glucan endo-1,3-beta-glucosidase A1-like protein n=1 Tax=Drechmeria coniospora TaxID=98403 RepID=A0A151GNZ7_DRECN|nr:glucan endo-1,3-beta-glucosidase A1-like protein [Drechmeria coniospora]KYK58771.1 glucan endo-1,3-beta-glucosidase A1-like protein [Drechmeria coniospora]